MPHAESTRPSLRLLAMDAAGATLSLALLVDGEVAAEAAFRAGHAMSRRILCEIEALLERCGCALEDVGAFAATLGPGSFTGVRTGLATCRALAWAAHKPAAGANTLAVLAMNAAGRPGLIAAALDARKNEVYFAVYAWDGDRPREVRPPDVLPPARAVEVLERMARPAAAPLWCLGDGAPLLWAAGLAAVPGAQPEPLAVHHVPRAAHLGALVFDEVARAVAEGATERYSPLLLQPLYVRPSEAEVHAQAREAGQVAKETP